VEFSDVVDSAKVQWC